jgi:hypothetical protein
MAVEAVIGEPCSTDLPKNSEFTGNFPSVGALSYADTAEKPRSNNAPMRLCDQRQ